MPFWTEATSLQILISEDDTHEGRPLYEVILMSARDAKLAAPHLLMPSIQVNMRAGKFPPAETNGVRYLKIPVSLAG